MVEPSKLSAKGAAVLVVDASVALVVVATVVAAVVSILVVAVVAVVVSILVVAVDSILVIAVVATVVSILVVAVVAVVGFGMGAVGSVVWGSGVFTGTFSSESKHTCFKI